MLHIRRSVRRGLANHVVTHVTLLGLVRPHKVGGWLGLVLHPFLPVSSPQASREHVFSTSPTTAATQFHPPSSPYCPGDNRLGNLKHITHVHVKQSHPRFTH